MCLKFGQPVGLQCSAADHSLQTMFCLRFAVSAEFARCILVHSVERNPRCLLQSSTWICLTFLRGGAGDPPVKAASSVTLELYNRAAPCKLSIHVEISIKALAWYIKRRQCRLDTCLRTHLIDHTSSSASTLSLITSEN